MREFRTSILPFLETPPKHNCHILLFYKDGKVKHGEYVPNKSDSGRVDVYTENSYISFKWDFLVRDSNHLLGWNYYKGEIFNA